MTTINTSINIAGITFKNPIMPASGTFGSGQEYSEFVDLNQLGAVVTKGVSLTPWEGNPAPRIMETSSGMINAVGLQNPGIDVFIERDIPFLQKFDTKIIVNVCGNSVSDYLQVVERLSETVVDMLEINISCPNVEHGGIAFGQEPKMVEYITSEIKKITPKPISMKLTPNVTDITEIAKSKQDEIRKNIEITNKYMNEHDKNNEPKEEIGMKCSKPYKCEFWEYCTRNLPKPNVFDIGGGMHTSKKFEKYYEGKVSFQDLQNEDLNSKFLEQIDFELNNLEPKIEKEAIKELMDSLKYPLYFIDYETYQLAIPKTEGTKPYQQLPFQYSLHIIKEKGAPIEHKEFLAEIDDTDYLRHFAESMIKDMPENGSVIIYNKSFEPARNNEIARMYPDLKDEMDRINSNIVDFLEPFKQRKYYTKEMHGSASIKAVLPALYPNNPELDYL